MTRIKTGLKSKLRAGVATGAALAFGATITLAHNGQHGTFSGHLLGQGAWGNIELVSKFEVIGAKDDLIADVTAFGKYAYLANWGEPDCAGAETGGVNTPDSGAWVVDISDPANPKQVNFIPMPQDTRPGEGMQVVRLNTKWFKGDMLVMNAEACGKNYKGGFMIYDVTNPLKPVKLKEGFGDRTGSDAQQTHSAFAWQSGANAYLVTTDNEDVQDVDIYDITNPRSPVLVSEVDLNTFGVAQLDLNLGESFLHDMVVKKIGDKFIMVASYWDGGYNILDVTNPAKPVFVSDTDFAAIDPELSAQAGINLTPEGNAHQAEFTLPNPAGKRFMIGTDEDFSANRAVVKSSDGGSYPAAEFSWTAPFGGSLSGPTVYGGFGCPADRPNVPPASVLPPLATGEKPILVLQRGPTGADACFFSEKVETAQLAGYGAVVIANHHVGALGGDAPDTYACGSQGHDFSVSISAVCIGHRGMHELFDDLADNFSDPETVPTVGTLGDNITITTQFDGWGYVHLFDATSLESVKSLDTFAIPEAMKAEYASGFGDLTVHEVAADLKQWDKAYLSYYSGGLRSMQIQCTNNAEPSTCGLKEIGGYLAPEGNDFWGVEVIPDPKVPGGQLILASDRDHGLYIFRAK